MLSFANHGTLRLHNDDEEVPILTKHDNGFFGNVQVYAHYLRVGKYVT